MARMNKLFLLLAALVLGSLAAQGATAKIESPYTAQTSASWIMSNHRLFWNNKDQTLYAEITFDNRLYSDRTNPPDHESFLFPFPGVKLDPKTKTFYVESKTGQHVPVAETHTMLFWKTIEPLPGTRIFVIKKSGTIKVTLTADTEATPDNLDRHWMECSEDQWLQNLLRSF